MRSVVRAAYSGRLRGSSAGGGLCNSAKGSKRFRLASPRKTRSPRIKRTARMSHRLNKRVQPPTDIGTNTRMVWASYRKPPSQNCREKRERAGAGGQACDFPPITPAAPGSSSSCSIAHKKANKDRHDTRRGREITALSNDQSASTRNTRFPMEGSVGIAIGKARNRAGSVYFDDLSGDRSGSVHRTRRARRKRAMAKTGRRDRQSGQLVPFRRARRPL